MSQKVDAPPHLNVKGVYMAVPRPLHYSDSGSHPCTYMTPRKLAGGPLACFGHSMGGALLYIVAVQRPDLFTRLVIFDPPMFHPAKRLGMQLAFPFSALRRLHPLVSHACSEVPRAMSAHSKCLSVFRLP